jgi:putative transposase
MVDTRYQQSSGSVFSLKYYFVWCPKFRRKVLVGDIKKDLRSLLHQKAQEMQVTIESLQILPDQVHIYVKSDPTEAPSALLISSNGIPPTCFGKNILHYVLAFPVCGIGTTLLDQ